MEKIKQTGWPSHNGSRATGIPAEIIIRQRVVHASNPQHQREQSQHVTNKAAIKQSGTMLENTSLETSSSTCSHGDSSIKENLSLETPSSTRSKDDSEDEKLSRDSTGYRNDLWKGASDGSGPIKNVDTLCSHSVTQMMSRNDAARQKILDDMLNHGEF